MTISTVKNNPAVSIYEVTLGDGTLLWVPQDPLNSDYVRVQAWVAAGGTITA
jgi:hypothetical protein